MISRRSVSNVPVLAALLAAGALQACALHPPPRDCASQSREGIGLAVVGQRCDQANETDMREQLTEVRLLVRVHNPTKERATVHREDFRLSGDDRFAVRTSTWGAAEPLDVQPGADQTFDLRFMARGAFECAKEVRLDPGTGIVTRNQPVKMPALSFVAGA